MGLWPSNKRLSTLSLFTPRSIVFISILFYFIFQSAKHGENCGGCGVRCSAVIDSKLKLNKQYTENERARVNEMWGVNDTLSSRFRRRISNKFVPMVAVSDPFSFHPFLLFSFFLPPSVCSLDSLPLPHLLLNANDWNELSFSPQTQLSNTCVKSGWTIRVSVQSNFI